MIASFCIGLIFGSFTNVIIHRLPEEALKEDAASRLGKGLLRLIWPRSFCLACGGGIAAYDNIPVLSYLFLRGKCRKCRAPISPRYPVVECLMGLLFLAAHIRFGLNLELLIRDWPFLVLMVAITFIDLQHRIIPDILNLIGVILAIATAGMAAEVGYLNAAIGAGLGFGLFYFFAKAYEL
ncbi:MAG: prepilin peptidase, partial [Bdellovibrionota bacterium]